MLPTTLIVTYLPSLIVLINQTRASFLYCTYAAYNQFLSLYTVGSTYVLIYYSLVTGRRSDPNYIGISIILDYLNYYKKLVGP